MWLAWIVIGVLGVIVQIAMRARRGSTSKSRTSRSMMKQLDPNIRMPAVLPLHRSIDSSSLGCFGQPRNGPSRPRSGITS